MRDRRSLAASDFLAMVRLTPQQSSDLLGAIQDSASHAAGFADSLAVAGQTDAALVEAYQSAKSYEDDAPLQALRDWSHR